MKMVVCKADQYVQDKRETGYKMNEFLIAETVEDVLGKYEEAEKITPPCERVMIFSWADMLLLKAEIERLKHCERGL